MPFYIRNNSTPKQIVIMKRAGFWLSVWQGPPAKSLDLKSCITFCVYYNAAIAVLHEISLMMDKRRKQMDTVSIQEIRRSLTPNSLFLIIAGISFFNHYFYFFI